MRRSRSVLLAGADERRNPAAALPVEAVWQSALRAMQLKRLAFNDVQRFLAIAEHKGTGPAKT